MPLAASYLVQPIQLTDSWTQVDFSDSSLSHALRGFW